MADWQSSKVACDDPLCPPHVNGVMDFDLEAWADAWFYTNPIFIEVTGDDDEQMVRVELSA